MTRLVHSPAAFFQYFALAKACVEAARWPVLHYNHLVGISTAAAAHLTTPAQEQNDRAGEPGVLNHHGEQTHSETSVSARHGEGTPGDSSMSEQQLAELFDQELQQRLVAAVQKRAEPANEPSSSHQLHDQGIGVATATPGPTPYGSLSTAASTENSSRPAGAPPPLFRQLFPPLSSPASTSFNPLVSKDPWSPITPPSVARRQLPEQVVHLLRKAGVTQEAATATVWQLGQPASTVSNNSSSSCGNAFAGSGDSLGGSSSSSICLDGQDTPRRSLNSSTDEGVAAAGYDSSAAARHSSGNSRRTKLWSRAAQDLTVLPLSPKQQQQQQQQQAANSNAPHLNPLEVLSKLQTKQLVQLMDDCQAPSYGGKKVLLQRLLLLLQEQSQLQAENAQESLLLQQHDKEAFTGQSIQAGSVVSGQQQFQEQQSQPVDQQQDLLPTVVDVHKVVEWLLTARAQDVCVVDVRDRGGLQTELVVATGLNQRHTRALVEAVAWQLREAALQNSSPQQLATQADTEAAHSSSRDVLHDGLDAHNHPDATSKESWGQPGAGPGRWAAVQSQLQVQGVPLASGAAASQLSLPPLNIVGEGSSEWCLLDAGSVTVHVLTERARRFYALETLWGGPRGQNVKWFKPTQPQLETKDTIGRPQAPPLAVSRY